MDYTGFNPAFVVIYLTLAACIVVSIRWVASLIQRKRR